MLAIEANTFSGYGGLRQVELGKPESAKDRVLVRITAAGVTPAAVTRTNTLSSAVAVRAIRSAPASPL